MRRLFGNIRRTVFVCLCAAVAACSPVVDRHGYAPSDRVLDEVIVGVDTKESVAETVGRPTAAGILANSGWYYVESTFETIGPFEKREVDRQVVAISFDQTGTVTNIERFGLEEGNVVALSRRVTDSNVQGLSFLRQLLGNIGSLDAGSLLGE